MPRRLEALWVPEALVAAMVAVWAGTFVYLPKLRHDRFGTFGFDLGIYDQGIWLLSRFESPFVTIRGLDLFGHHVNVIALLLAPFYWLGAGPIFLLVVQVLSQASGAVAIFLLGRDVLRSRWAGAGLAAALLLNPTYQWLTWEFFHPDAVAIGPLLFAYWAARTARWRWFAVAATLALACKEDVALAMAILGLIVLFRGERRRGAIVALASAAWFVIATRAIIPLRNGIGPFYDTFFESYLGQDIFVMPFRAVAHAGKTYDYATAADRKTWYWKMSAPWALLAFFDIRVLVIAAPTIAVNVLTSFPYTRDYRFHYSSLVLAASALATAEAIAWMAARRNATSSAITRTALVSVVLGAAIVCSHAWGAAPYAKAYNTGIWPLHLDPRVRLKQEAIRQVPAHASVSAMFDMVPHLTHREKVYEFPVPWCNFNWGVRGENLDDPARVQWLVVDRTLLSSRDSALLNDLLKREFRTRWQADDLVVADRIRPPAKPAGANPPAGACYPRPGVRL